MDRLEVRDIESTWKRSIDQLCESSMSSARFEAFQ